MAIYSSSTATTSLTPIPTSTKRLNSARDSQIHHRYSDTTISAAPLADQFGFRKSTSKQIRPSSSSRKRRDATLLFQMAAPKSPRPTCCLDSSSILCAWPLLALLARRQGHQSPASILLLRPTSRTSSLSIHNPITLRRIH